MVDAVIDEIDGRMIRVGDRWLADFASCNYLGLDLDREIIDAVPDYLATWGTHPSWSRLLGSPVLYERIEATLADLLGAPDVLLLPTITHIHLSVIPVLAGNGTVFLDSRAHKTIYDGCAVAEGHGASIRRFRHADAEDLRAQIRASDSAPRLICMDGVNSMTGNAPEIGAFADLAREHDALLYVDDAHGFGVIGERSRHELCEYGTRGNSIVRNQAERYDNIVLVAGMSKAYSSLLAFVACPLEGLRVNEGRGDARRARVHALTRRVLDGLDLLGIATPNRSGYPIVEIPLTDPDDVGEIGRYLFDHGIYVTLAAYPLVPKREVGFRVQLTAANTDEQVDDLLRVLGELADRLQPAPEPGVAADQGQPAGRARGR
jgi:8-amino-7-oxononanoate synthase